MGRLARFIRFYTDEDDGNGGEKGVLKTVTGTIIHILDALKKPVNKFTATLEPIQDLHGQDAPYPAGGGKNKFICYDNLTITPSGVTCTFNGHSVTLVGTATADIILNLTWGQAIYIIGAELESGATYTWSAKTEGTIPNTISIYGGHLGTSVAQVGPFNPSGSASKAIPSEGTYYDRVWMQIHEGEVFNGTLYIQTEKGSSKTSYAPYSNECPITGHTGANVVRTGVNVWDEVTELGGISNTTGQPYNDNTQLRTKNFTRIEPSTAYYFTSSASLQICYYDSNKQLISVAYGRGVKTSPNTAYYCKLSFGSPYGTTYSNDTAINYPATDTSYHAYSGTTIPITFPDAAGTVYGAKLINEETETWKLRVTDVLFEKNTSTMDNNEDYPGWRNCGITAIIGSGYNQVFANQQMNIGTIYGANTSGSNDLILLPKAGNSGYGKTQTEWIALAQDVQIVIPLATPIEYTITESQALTLLKGENVVWCDASDSLELQYYAKAEETP